METEMSDGYSAKVGNTIIFLLCNHFIITSRILYPQLIIHQSLTFQELSFS